MNKQNKKAPINLIGISGKIGSGKDLVGKIIQYLTYCPNDNSTKEFIDRYMNNTANTFDHKWQIKKFADKLKDIVCILTGCTKEQLEDQEFKNSLLGEEWGKIKENPLNSVSIFENIKFNHLITFRQLLQTLGTDLLRNQLHENVWINALFADYKEPVYKFDLCDLPKGETIESFGIENCKKLGKLISICDWIVTDVRFKNEAKAIKDRGGILIRVNRNWGNTDNLFSKHSSETDLDNYKFDYTVENNGTIEELINKVKEILIKENIISD